MADVKRPFIVHWSYINTAIALATDEQDAVDAMKESFGHYPEFVVLKVSEASQEDLDDIGFNTDEFIPDANQTKH